MIMLTASDSNADYEIGCCADVDHYLSKKLPPAVLMGRVQLAFHAIASRKLPRNTRFTWSRSIGNRVHTRRVIWLAVRTPR